MIRTQESTGKTVDEARAKACALLGVQADDLNVSYEVLEMPQKTGFLGLKTTPAKVRVSVELPDAPAAVPAKPVEVVAEQPVETAAPCRRLLLWQRKRPLLWQSLPLPPQSRHPLPSSPPRLPRRQKRWKSPSSSRRTPR